MKTSGRTAAGRVAQRRLCWGVAALATVLFIVAVRGAPASSAPISPDEQPLSDASVVMGKVVERAKAMAQSRASYTYNKSTVAQEFDASGKLIKATQKEYRVTLVSGYPISRLTRIQGRSLSGSELEKENRRESEMQRKFTTVDAQKMAERRESWVTQELIDRFQFVPQKRALLGGRPTVWLSFSPKAPRHSENGLQDKILNGLAGVIAVDEEDSAVVQLKIGLRKPLPLGWFGFMGILTRCDIALEKQRLSDGTWANLNQTIVIIGRRLLTPMHYQVAEHSTDFEIVPAKAEAKTGAP